MCRAVGQRNGADSPTNVPVFAGIAGRYRPLTSLHPPDLQSDRRKQGPPAAPAVWPDVADLRRRPPWRLREFPVWPLCSLLVPAQPAPVLPAGQTVRPAIEGPDRTSAARRQRALQVTAAFDRRLPDPVPEVLPSAMLGVGGTWTPQRRLPLAHPDRRSGFLAAPHRVEPLFAWPFGQIGSARMRQFPPGREGQPAAQREHLAGTALRAALQGDRMALLCRLAQRPAPLKGWTRHCLTLAAAPHPAAPERRPDRTPNASFPFAAPAVSRQSPARRPPLPASGQPFAVRATIEGPARRSERDVQEPEPAWRR